MKYNHWTSTTILLCVSHRPTIWTELMQVGIWFANENEVSRHHWATRELMSIQINNVIRNESAQTMAKQLKTDTITYKLLEKIYDQGEIGELTKFAKISRHQITNYWAYPLSSNNIGKLNIRQIVIFPKPPNIITTNISRFTVHTQCIWWFMIIILLLHCHIMT